MGGSMTKIKPKLLVTRNLPAAVERRLARDYQAKLNPDDRLYDSDGLIEAAAGMDGLLPCPTDRLDAAVLARLPAGVKIIATYSVGFDHIDLAAARGRGLVVTNTPDVLTDATADIALLLMLAAARRAHEGEALVRADGWTAWSPKFMLGVHLGGKRLGILGMGRIGQALAMRARALGMAVHYHNRRRLPAAQEQGAVFHEAAETLLAVSDVLSLHCPASADTHHFLNARRIALLPDGAIVVNTARGAVVEDDALIAALAGGKVFAAGLDVFEGEPRIHPGYRNLPNVFLLPHLGSATLETREAMGFRALDNLDAFFAGREPRDRLV